MLAKVDPITGIINVPHQERPRAQPQQTNQERTSKRSPATTLHSLIFVYVVVRHGNSYPPPSALGARPLRPAAVINRNPPSRPAAVINRNCPCAPRLLSIASHLRNAADALQQQSGELNKKWFAHAKKGANRSRKLAARLGLAQPAAKPQTGLVRTLPRPPFQLPF